MVKRKSDEQRACEYADEKVGRWADYNYLLQEAYLAGIRSERRALKREQAERLNRLLAEQIAEFGTDHAMPYYRQEGIRIAMRALGIKETAPKGAKE